MPKFNNLFYRFFCLSILSLIVFFLIAQPLGAQLVKSVTPESASNPKPDQYDFILPLPCNLSMAFRVIFIPKKGYLGELDAYFGEDMLASDGAVQDASFINNKRKVYLGSSLSIDNLPQSYQGKAQALQKQLGADNEKRPLYLIGKYEVTNAQYQAVMYEKCDIAADSARPVVSVSFYDALGFTSMLMEYLLKNAPESLPRNLEDKRNVGLIRLPTEDEWEYAARGAHYVDPETLSSEDFFPMEEGKTVKNYGLYYDEIKNPVRNPTNIGSYLPNPAGLYDTIGNASELIFGTFKMTMGSRLHGSSGGPVYKGGSFRSVYKDVMSGTRAEFAFFFDTGPAKSTDLGFRVLISSVNMGSMEKLKILEDEYNSLAPSSGEDSMVDPLKVVNSLIKNASSDEEKKSYENLLTTLTAYNKSVEEQKVLNIRNYIWNLIYNILGIRTNSFRIETVEDDINAAQTGIDRAKKLIANPNTEDSAKKNQEKILPKHEESLKINQDELQKLNDSYTKQRVRYNNLLLQSRDFSADMIFKELTLVKQGLTGNDTFTTELKRCFETVVKNLDFVMNKNGKPESIKREELELKIKK